MKKICRFIEQAFTYLPLAGILVASLLNVSKFQQQLLILFAILWMNAFFLYKSWFTQ